MKQYAKCRDYEEGESFPFVRLDGSEGMYPCSETLYENWMPEAIENDEFNMLILLDGEMVKVRSIHFDFIDHPFKKTMNYSLFKMHNEGLKEFHLLKLIRSIENKDLSMHTPIIVDHKYNIIDGNHRFVVLMCLNKPIYYKILNEGE